MQTAIAENKPVSRTNEKIGAQKTVSLSLTQNDYYSLRFIDWTWRTKSAYKYMYIPKLRILVMFINV